MTSDDLQIVGMLFPAATGWTFPEPVTGAIIRAGGHRELVVAVAQHRRLSGIPVGDPAAEVLAHICARNPNVCRPRGGKRVFGGRPVSLPSFSDEVRDWLGRLLGVSPGRVSETECRRRAAACRACPKNVKPTGGCLSCSVSSTIATMHLTRGVDAKELSGLKACSTYRWSNKVAVLIDIPMESSAPVGCWRGGAAANR